MTHWSASNLQVGNHRVPNAFSWHSRLSRRLPLPQTPSCSRISSLLAWRLWTTAHPGSPTGISERRCKRSGEAGASCLLQAGVCGWSSNSQRRDVNAMLTAGRVQLSICYELCWGQIPPRLLHYKTTFSVALFHSSNEWFVFCTNCSVNTSLVYSVNNKPQSLLNVMWYEATFSQNNTTHTVT